MLVWHPVFSSKAEPRTVSSWVLPAVIQEPGLMRLAQVASTISQVADIWRLDMRRQRKCDQSSFPSDTIQAHVQNWLEKLGNLVKQCPQQEDVGNWYGGPLLSLCLWFWTCGSRSERYTAKACVYPEQTEDTQPGGNKPGGIQQKVSEIWLNYRIHSDEALHG